MREKWWAMLQTCWAVKPMDRPALADLEPKLYLPTSVNDPRNETHGYTLGTDDDVSHENCEGNAYVHYPFLVTSLSSKIKIHNSRVAAFGLTNLRRRSSAFWARKRTTAIRATMRTTAIRARTRTTLLRRPCNNISISMWTFQYFSLEAGFCVEMQQCLHTYICYAIKQMFTGALDVDRDYYYNLYKLLY